MRKFPRIKLQSNRFLNLFSSTQNIYFSVQSYGQSSKHHTCIPFLPDLAKINSLNEAKSLHAVLVIMPGSFPSQQPVFIHNNLISKYAHFGDIYSAHKLFEQMSERNIVSYNTMIGSYSRDGFVQKAWELFSEMRKCYFNPTQFTFGSLLSCYELGAFQGMQLHALIEKTGLIYADAFAGTSLLGMYGRCSYLDEAIGVFEIMPTKNLVTWNSLISVFGQMGFVEDCVFMFSEMIRNQIEVSEYTFVSVLSVLEEVDMHLGEQIHGLVIKSAVDNVASVSNCLISMYAKFGGSCLAESVFGKVLVKDIVSWNSLIGTVVNKPAKGLDFFLKMCMTGSTPNKTTLLNVLNSCSRLQIPSCGEYIHAKMIKKSFDSDVYAGSALVNFYAKFDKVQEAHVCFDGIAEKNLVSWNSLMNGYSKRGPSFNGWLFQEMIRSGQTPNEVSFSIAIKSSLHVELLLLHGLTIKTGYEENAYVQSSLISSYAKNGMVSEALVFAGSGLPVVSSNLIAWIYNRTGQYDKAQELYVSMEDPDTVSWNILIAACSRNGDYAETFELFDHMRRSQVYPDNYTYVSLFSVCTKICNLALGSSIHCHIIKTHFKSCDTFVCNVMIDMYGKCGSLEGSIKIFNNMVDKNVISWTALVSAFGLHGYANEALEAFGEMDKEGSKPDRVAFLAVLSSCRHVGLVKEGIELFNQMKLKYGVEPEMDHYILAVDMLARYGHLKEAEKLILEMPFPPNVLIWRTFLEGCKKQRNTETLALVA